MVGNIGDRVMLPEKVVISKRKKVVTCNATRDQYEFTWLMCREICLAFLLCQQTKKFGKLCFRPTMTIWQTAETTFLHLVKTKSTQK